MIGNAVISTWQHMGYLNPDRVMVSAYTMGAQTTPLTKCQVVWQDSPLPLQQGGDLRDRLTLWLIAPASASGDKSELSWLEQSLQLAIMGSLGDPRFYHIIDPDDGHNYSDVRIYPDSSAQMQTPPLSGVQAATITCTVTFADGDVAWPSKDFSSGDKEASHIDADDPSILDVGVVPSAYEYRAARSTLSDLQADRKYEIRFESRYAPDSAHATGDMYVGVNKAGVIMWSAHLDLSKVTDDWVEHTVQFGPVDAAQTTGITQIVTVKHDGQDNATVQLRDFRLIDIAQGGVDDSVDPWIITWRQVGFRLDDDILTYHSSGKLSDKSSSSIESDDHQITRTYPRILHVKPSHTYVFSVDFMTSTPDNAGDDTLVFQLQGATWDWLDCWAEDDSTDWVTRSKTIEIPSDQAETTVPLGIKSTDSHARTWRLRNLRFEDITG